MRRTLVLFLALATCLFALPQKPLTNDDIIKMVKGGLSDDVILLAIDSQPSNFDISPQALIELKQQGASKAVLDKILEVAAAKRRAASPPSQAQSQVAPPPSGPIQTLSPADEQRVRTLVEQAVSQSRRLLAQPMEQNLHELLDQGLSGGDLPAPFKDPFVALFAPYRQALHQFLDQEAGRSRQQLKKPSGPRSNLKGPSPFLRPVLWAGGKAFPNEVRPDPMVESRRRSASRPYRDPSLWLLNSQPACGEKSTSGSETVGDGVTITLKFVDWVDTPDSIASGGGSERDITADPTVPVQGMRSGKQSTKIMGGACVDRCPTADGKVAGKSEFGWEFITEVTKTTGAVGSDRELYQEDATAEGHVGDDARLRDVAVQADGSVEKRVGSDLTIMRWQGTGAFDPHGLESEVPLQLTGCSWTQGVIPVVQCSTLLKSAAVFHPSTLRDAYLRAERKWNFWGPEPGDFSTSGAQGSKCVIAKFTPPTKTVKGSPGQRVPVKTELIAVKGNQPTWGVFNKLEPIATGGDIQANGTRTSPDAPAQLTYTAPSKQWPLDDPPGFGVYLATSRAGVLKDGGQIEEDAGVQDTDWKWFLAPGGFGLRVRMHAVMQIANFNSTFDLGNTGPGSEPPVVPLHFADDGSFSGEATVDTAQANARPGPVIACAGGNVQRVRLVVTGKLKTNSKTIIDSPGNLRPGSQEKMEVKLDVNGVSARAAETCKIPGVPMPPANVVGELPVRGFSYNFSLDPIVGATQTVPLNVLYYTGEVQITLVSIK